MVNSERGRNHYGSCPLLCLLMNKSTLKLATQAVATINLKGSNFINDSDHNILYNLVYKMFIGRIPEVGKQALAGVGVPRR